MNISEQIKLDCKFHQLFQTGDRVLVGVSGGSDSVALLTILKDLSHELGVTLQIAHFNHQLRPSADRDQKFVEALAKKYNIPCRIKKSVSLKNKTKGSLEELARKERFNFFRKVVDKDKLDCVALAHTKDDLAETVLMRIVRGSGLQGMRAIMPKTEIGRIMFIRPMLGIRKADVLEYLRGHNIVFKEDPTNRQTKFFRNKIRLKLIPLLEKDYNPQITDALVKLSCNLSDDFDYLELQTQKLYKRICHESKNSCEVKLEYAPFLKQHQGLQKMIIRKIYKDLKGDLNRLTNTNIQEVLDLIRNRPEKAVVNWPHNISISKNKEELSFRLRNKA